MKKTILILALITFVIAGCTIPKSNENFETTGDESTDELGTEITDFNDLNNELGDLDDFNLDDLDF